MPTIDDYKNFFADLCKRTGIKALESDDAGLVSVRVQDEYNVNFQFLKPSGKILCFVEVADLPKDAGREVYRELPARVAREQERVRLDLLERARRAAAPVAGLERDDERAGAGGRETAFSQQKIK